MEQGAQPTEPLNRWLERQYRYSAHAMLQSVSPVTLLKSRPGFGQVVRPVKGSIVASPVLAAYDPDPDYFFHWFRDSAVVVDALRLLFESGAMGEEAVGHVADFVAFSLALGALDGRVLATSPAWRAGVAEDFKQYVRSEADLAIAHGDRVVAETRVNPDGTLDISRWCRPQFDGPALRALALLRWIGDGAARAARLAGAAALIRADLSFVVKHWREPSFDIWEEESGQHYYTLCVSAAALAEGATWLERIGETHQAHLLQTESGEILRTLEVFWLPDAGYYRSRVLTCGSPSAKELDIAVLLAAIHAARADGPHSVHDPRMHATLERLETLFEQAYPINHHRPAGRGIAMGRYANDVYYSGGAYYFSTLGAAEFCFRAARGVTDSQRWLQRGDAFLQTVQEFTPPGGELSEQFDKSTGVQTSGKHLAWSYAALISCVAARRQAMQHR